MAKEIVIVSAVRTPIGSFMGGLADMPAEALGSIVISSALSRCKIDPKDVSEVIMGQVLTAGQGQNPARKASVNAGIPLTVPAHGVSLVCGSGLKAVISGAQAIKCGDAEVEILLMETLLFKDTMLIDGLTDIFEGYHMGITAENIVEKYGLSREAQDKFAYESQMKAKAAMEANIFESEIVPVTIPPKRKSQTATILDKDEFRTAGNASGLNDGAAAVVITSKDYALQHNIPILASIVSYAKVGVEPSIMGTGPIPAVRAALEKAGWSKDEVDLYELNEAFASQSLACLHDLQLDPTKVNVNGGAIALGHPIGASGCRVLVTLVQSMIRRGAKKGVVSLCIGGGMGIAICLKAS
ncbi:E2.3.1.9 [Lepeophtheirus salmonis]|uniref:E2.3.1.9 n=1 Tax=Lepeophtheirus salmonis TaxID=72036 RepID=A0A7R8D390_LEPSM|nr:E2.3.1.9 [Lepeophtheirus salmonis]CAF3014578.1 E2.3.1.9 [Lepeophtheirus salmonis]